MFKRFDGLDEAHKTLWEWYGSLEGVRPARKIPDAVLEALADDLNTPAMIAELHKLFNGKQFPELLASLKLLGFTGKRYNLARTAAGEEKADRADIERLIAERLAARKAKNWAEADRIRDALAAKGVILKDAKNPATGEIETAWEIAR